jgi:hypothetical protein
MYLYALDFFFAWGRPAQWYGMLRQTMTRRVFYVPQELFCPKWRVSADLSKALDSLGIEVSKPGVRWSTSAAFSEELLLLYQPSQTFPMGLAKRLAPLSGV